MTNPPADTPLVTGLAPILLVSDLDAEIAFYEALGFSVGYRGSEFPNFVSLHAGNIAFGIKLRESFDPKNAENALVWQLAARSLQDVLDIAAAHEWRTRRSALLLA